MAEYGPTPRWDEDDPHFIEDNGSFLVKYAWEGVADELVRKRTSKLITSTPDLPARIRAIIGHALIKHVFGVTNGSSSPRADIKDTKDLKPNSKSDFADALGTSAEYLAKLAEFKSKRDVLAKINPRTPEVEKQIEDLSKDFAKNQVLHNGSPGGHFMGLHAEAVQILEDPSQVLTIEDSQGNVIKTIIVKFHGEPKPKMLDSAGGKPLDAVATVLIINHDINIETSNKPAGTMYRYIDHVFLNKLLEGEKNRAIDNGRHVHDTGRVDPGNSPNVQSTASNGADLSSSVSEIGGISQMSAPFTDSASPNLSVLLPTMPTEIADTLIDVIRDNLEEICGVDEDFEDQIGSTIEKVNNLYHRTGNIPSTSQPRLTLQEGKDLSYALVMAATSTPLPLVDTATGQVDPLVKAIEVARVLAHDVAKTTALDAVLKTGVLNTVEDRDINKLFEWERTLSRLGTVESDDPLRESLARFYEQLPPERATDLRDIFAELELPMVGTMIGIDQLTTIPSTLGPVRGRQPVSGDRKENLDKAIAAYEVSESLDVALLNRTASFVDAIRRDGLSPDSFDR